MLIADLKPGDVLEHKDIIETFKVGNMGGMRRSLAHKCLILISDPYKGLYLDAWKDDVLHYTGMGKIGDQGLDYAQNHTLANSGSNGVAVHLFEVLQPTVYTYQGEVELVGKPYQETQPDEKGQVRKVWMFPLKIKAGKAPVIVEEDVQKQKAQELARKARKLSNKELAIRAGNKKGKPGKRKVLAAQYDRDPSVIEYVIRRSKGRCELCEADAPFIKPDGEPCLEVHHVNWLSEGGDDTTDNAVALCPNCHRKMHSLKFAVDIAKLKRIASVPLPVD